MCKVLCFVRKIYVILYILVSHCPPEDLSVCVDLPGAVWQLPTIAEIKWLQHSIMLR